MIGVETAMGKFEADVQRMLLTEPRHEKYRSLPVRVVAEAVSEWYYPRPVPGGTMPDRLQRVLRVLDQWVAAYAAAQSAPVESDVLGRHAVSTLGAGDERG